MPCCSCRLELSLAIKLAQKSANVRLAPHGSYLRSGATEQRSGIRCSSDTLDSLRIEIASSTTTDGTDDPVSLEPSSSTPECSDTYSGSPEKVAVSGGKHRSVLSHLLSSFGKSPKNISFRRSLCLAALAARLSLLLPVFALWAMGLAMVSSVSFKPRAMWIMNGRRRCSVCVMLKSSGLDATPQPILGDSLVFFPPIPS